MKKILLLILSFAFLGLWVTGLFYDDTPAGIHLALIVALLFFFRSLMVTEVPAVKKTQGDNNY